MVTFDGPAVMAPTVSMRIWSKLTFAFFGTFAATPVPSVTRPSKMCSEPT